MDSDVQRITKIEGIPELPLHNHVPSTLKLSPEQNYSYEGRKIYFQSKTVKAIPKKKIL